MSGAMMMAHRTRMHKRPPQTTHFIMPRRRRTACGRSLEHGRPLLVTAIAAGVTCKRCQGLVFFDDDLSPWWAK